MKPPPPSKPRECLLRCAYKKGAGFVPCDSPAKVGPGTKVAFLLEAPGAWEGTYGWPVVGNTGRKLWGEIVEPLGYSRDDVFIDNVLRCQPPRYQGKQTYPTGKDRQAAETACRYWDAALDLWNPNLLSCTWHPAALFEDHSKERLVAEAVRKAFLHADAGFRPLLLMGEKAAELFAPYWSGQMKNWQGHWQPVTWKAQGGGEAALASLSSWNRPALVEVRT